MHYISSRFTYLLTYSLTETCRADAICPGILTFAFTITVHMSTRLYC